LGAEETLFNPVLANGLLQAALTAQHGQPLEMGEVALVARELGQGFVKVAQPIVSAPAGG
jgi:hypothetical protein